MISKVERKSEIRAPQNEDEEDEVKRWAYLNS